MDYNDIRIEFDTEEQAQAFAEAVQKNGHPIDHVHTPTSGRQLGSAGHGGLMRYHRDFDVSSCVPFRLAPAEWIHFLLSPAKKSGIKVAGHDVKITAEDAKIGCTTVTWEEVKTIYKAMKEARK